MNSHATNPRARLLRPRWLQQAASGLAALLIVLSTMLAVLLTSDHGAEPTFASISAGTTRRAPLATLQAPRDEACACSRISTAVSDRARRLALARGSAAKESIDRSDRKAIPPPSHGVSGSPGWIMSNRQKLEHDPRAFLRLMSHLARFRDDDLVRLPGAAPTARPGSR